MKRILKSIVNRVGYDIQIKKKQFDKHEDVIVSLHPKTNGASISGNVLLAYIIDPFLLDDKDKIPNTHTHFWESYQIANSFLDMGYNVDVISYLNTSFKPEKKYNIFVSARTNFERIAKMLDPDCITIAHLDMAHWLYNNVSALQRCYDLQIRRKKTLRSYRLQEENYAIENADYGVVLGNGFTIDTYRYANKPIFRVNIPSCAQYPWNNDKNYPICKNNFIWFGSKGLIHKGLDLVLEAFAEMPEYSLTVCAPFSSMPEKEFESVYRKELYNTDNIKTIGWVDIESEKFRNLAANSIAIVYPSCSEGGGAAVITCMHAGLIPIASYESSVDIDDDFGILLKRNTIEEIKHTICLLSSKDDRTLMAMSKRAWEVARTHYTRENYMKQYPEVIKNILKNHL
jgi:glycosyltransferase involved in cell wall biosynthesis